MLIPYSASSAAAFWIISCTIGCRNWITTLACDRASTGDGSSATELRRMFGIEHVAFDIHIERLVADICRSYEVKESVRVMVAAGCSKYQERDRHISVGNGDLKLLRVSSSFKLVRCDDLELYVTSERAS